MIRKTKIIFFDEASMPLKYFIEGLDRTLQDLMNNSEPFGGNVIFLGGDHRQLQA